MKTQNTPSPFLQLAAARTCRSLRIPAQRIPRNSMLPGCHAALARLRADELAAWQASGGDYLRSGQDAGKSTTNRLAKP